MYHIYHIPGVKIGCTTNPKRRTKNQGFDEYEILEQWDDIDKASEREIELQKQYGYKVDFVPYWKSHEVRIKNTSIDARKKGGKTQGDIMAKTGRAAAIFNKFRSKAIATAKDVNGFKIKIYDVNKDKHIGDYNSLNDASKDIKISTPTISKYLKENKIYNGYSFQLIN